MMTEEEFAEISNNFRAKNNLCHACLGLGCLPEHFGMGNPDAQPCSECNGRGFKPKQLSLF